MFKPDFVTVVTLVSLISLVTDFLVKFRRKSELNIVSSPDAYHTEL